ncbi:MAG: hypothetical protein IPH18_06045 [Chitinophagaceae bacterium]|nr:hypothetical protein [Chitinophagaceae bacterium]
MPVLKDRRLLWSLCCGECCGAIKEGAPTELVRGSGGILLLSGAAISICSVTLPGTGRVKETQGGTKGKRKLRPKNPQAHKSGLTQVELNFVALANSSLHKELLISDNFKNT